MKMLNSGGCTFRQAGHILARAFAIAGFFVLTVSGRAQMPPPLTDSELAYWNFDGTNWLSPSLHTSPISYTNVANPPDWDGNALLVNSTNAAYFQENIVSDGQTNLIFNQGTIEFWFMPEWGSGEDPGDWGRLIDVGINSTNNPSSWFSLYFNPQGTNIYFSSETNGVFTNYLTVPIAWVTNEWHLIDLTYSASQTKLYLDGQLAATGLGEFYQPDESTFTNGFFIGSDITGTQQMRGQMDDLATYNYELSATAIAIDYTNGWDYMNGITPPGDDSGTNVPDYGTNMWLVMQSVSNNIIGLLLTNTSQDILYEIQGTTNLALGPSGWTSFGFTYGSELTNSGMAYAPISQQGNEFYRIRSWQDSTGTGIPDWWWITYFGQITNVDAYAPDPISDGFTDLQKYQMGLNPTNYYAPNPPGGFFGCLDITGTNAILEWTNASGPVVSYAIQRGILNTNTGGYAYTQFLVGSNATLFEDFGAISNANSQNNVYTLEAVYPGGGVSATDTWNVWWFARAGSYGPPYGPPPPGNVNASVDATGSNVLISWFPPQGGLAILATNYIIERGTNTGSYSYIYTPISQVGSNVTSFEDVGVLTNANGWSDGYTVTAVYPGGGLSYAVPTANYVAGSSPVIVGSGAGPAGPTNFFGYTDWEWYPWIGGTDLYLLWDASPGASYYLIYGGLYQGSVGFNQYTLLGEVTNPATSFDLPGGTDGNGNFPYNAYYVAAVYPDGSLSQSAAWYPGQYGPGLGFVDALVDTTGTNVVVTWGAVPDATSYIVQRSDEGGSGYYQIAIVDGGTTTFVDTDEVDNAYFYYDGYWYGYGVSNASYQVEATFPNGGYSAAATAWVSNTPPAPSYLSAALDPTGTNVLLTWTPAAGATNYVILRGTNNPATGDYIYAQIGEAGGSATSFEDAGAVNGNSYNYSYEIEALVDGELSAPDSTSLIRLQPATSKSSVTAQLVRNGAGRWQLMFSGIRADVQKIAFYWYTWYNFYDSGAYPDLQTGDQSFTSEHDIPVTSITNGVYVLPDFLTTNWFPNNAWGKVAMVQPVDADGQYGQLTQAGFQSYDSPVFADGRQHLKQNLLYELRAASMDGLNVSLLEHNVWFEPFFTDAYISTDTNFVENSIFHESWMFVGFSGSTIRYVKMDNIWPFTVNYELHPGLFDTIHPGATFNWQPDASETFEETLTNMPAPPVLGGSDPYWISQSLSDLAGVAAYTNAGNLYLQSGQANLYGLPFETALVNQELTTYYNGLTGQYSNYYGAPITVSPGGSTGMTNVSCFFSQTADPDLELAGYYFAPVNTPGTALPSGTTPYQPYPLPCQAGFANTNQTEIIITSVGTPTVIGGWAKFSIQNGNPNKFAYLGQYFETNAYVITNGVLTTNTTGVISPYGNFFPTEPGTVAMITMPDIDSGAQGTDVVRVISLNADANHDGTMDFSYSGPDFVSASKPFRFWVNDVNDSGDDGGDGIPGGNGSPKDGMVFSDGDNGPIYSIQGSRNLVNFFPVYLNIGSLFQSNALSAAISATDTNYQFVLSQADGALRFAYTDLTPTNYMNFLRDTNEVFDYLHDAPLITVSNLNSGGAPVARYFLNLIAGNNGGIILVEAWTNTTQPLVLTIYQGTNQIAQTQLYLSITGVEQMFRHKNILLNTNAIVMPDRLTDASVPNEPDTTDMNFIFVHGYNVNPQQARGWDADYYKRLYWSGSHAKFYGVTWEGSDSQKAGQVTINLQANIVNAFNTAPLLNTFLNSLSGTNVVAAHSLGNMVMLSTLNDSGNRNVSAYCMVDAAVAIEAIDATALLNPDMYPTAWTNYDSRLWASEWYNLFPTNDARSTLTWSGRLTNFQNTVVYNFYSSGEDVLRDYPNDPPSYLLFIALGQGLGVYEGAMGVYSWAWQEKLKGLMSANGLLSSNHGGWQFNQLYNPENYTSTNGLLLSDAEIQTNSLFNWSSISSSFFPFEYDLALESSDGDSYAQTNRNRILSDAIPCLTLPAGANPIPRLNALGRNFDMQGQLENGWPAGRPARQMGAAAAGEWHHSDNRAVAYTFTYLLFNQMVTLGNLK